MAYNEDASVFWGPNDPGVVALAINGTTVYGHFEHEMDETLESPTQRSVPVFLCYKYALPTVSVGDAAVVDALTYKVRLVEISDYDPVAYLHLNNT
jgi:hypothetical protein